METGRIQSKRFLSNILYVLYLMAVPKIMHSTNTSIAASNIQLVVFYFVEKHFWNDVTSLVPSKI